MSAKLKLILPFLIIALLLAGYSCAQTSSTEVAHKITLKITHMDDGTWKVQVDSINGHKNETHLDTVKVYKNAKITWEVDKTSDAYFQFPEDVVYKYSDTDTLSENYTILIKAGKKLKLKVKGDANTGPHMYAIFIMKDGVYARGDSPPIIIVN